MPFSMNIKQINLKEETTLKIDNFIKKRPMTIFEATIMRSWDIIRQFFDDGFLPTHKDNSGRTLVELLMEVDGKNSDVKTFVEFMLEQM